MRRVLLPVVCAMALAACGGEGRGGGTDAATLVLDSAPGAVHTGIYTALARDFDGAESVRLRVREPPEGADPARPLETGAAQLAILQLADFALAREEGRDVVAVMAVVQRPLAVVVARREIRSPRGLEGRRAGVTGLPRDTAVLRSIVEGDGGDPEGVEEVTVGFDAVRPLLAGRIDAATAHWDIQGLALRSRAGPRRFRRFRVEDYGAPAYPELVLCVTRETLRDEPDLVEGTVAALRRGYEEALKDPELAVETLLRRNRNLDGRFVRTELRALGAAFTAGGARFGELDRERLEAWSRWAVEFGVVEVRPDVDRAFHFG